ncbi:complex I subunit 4 family protein [Corynebacterium uterequi]|uniref:Proton-translocating NADH-quinone oxidoreductase, chain M n=1 Tax=Corynebacterium uterequi TaxID=1072256 RepID=A0A0G3HHM4_9CORY|nr:NADH-quinone oxidoreductase subunit M [Corynebacterium uterequi]AKK10632.1 proton-translocating NADH-quinone oxidoreductase, chain M [Corynebacterium uterequi]
MLTLPSFILTVAVVTPLLGALAIGVLSPTGRSARTAGIVVSLVPLAIAVACAVALSQSSAAASVGDFHFVDDLPWIPALGARYALGLDGIGLSMVLLTAVLTPIVLCYSGVTDYRSDQYSESTFVALILGVESMSLLVFSATDLLLFYLAFEATLIPMFFLIGGFGGRRRLYAALQFLLYSLASGLIMLAAIIGVFVVAGSFTYADLLAADIPAETQMWLFTGFMVAFITKAPMVPLHTWLPEAAANTTPGGATMMVAVMDKIGTFGMIRFAVLLFPAAAVKAAPVMIGLAVLSVIWGALAACAQTNLVKLVAYTSVSHFGFIVMGIFAFTDTTMTSAALYMVNHGISTAALFMVVGYLVRRAGTSDIDAFGGVQQVAPLLAGYLLIAGLSALSLPGLATFVSEFGVIVGTWPVNPWAAGISAIAMVLAAVYIMRMVKTVVSGPATPTTAALPELSSAERVIVAPLIVLLIVFGFYPSPIVNLLDDDAVAVVSTVLAGGK